MRNLSRINNYYNNQWARAHWAAEVKRAQRLGLARLLDEHAGIDPERMTWRKLDKHLGRLRERIGAAMGWAFSVEGQRYLPADWTQER